MKRIIVKNQKLQSQLDQITGWREWVLVAGAIALTFLTLRIYYAI